MVLIIAEAGVNHNGDMAMAKELINKASESGADYVKFQTFKTELAISPKAAKADYQVENAGEGTMFDMVKKLELSFEDFISLKEHCEQCGIGFLSTPFDLPSVDFLNQHQGLFKIPSGEITNLPYLEKIASLDKPMIMSTGMANLEEIGTALEILKSKAGASSDITVLHCNTEYPTPMQDVNLKAMLTIKEEFDVNIGYSDHTLGIEVPIAAVALGATVIEKHFTLDRNLPGPDHKASLEPDELKAMVEGIRNIEKAISGNGLKEPSESEKKNIAVARRSLHTARAMKSGQVITEEDLIAVRPAHGISPLRWYELLGKTTTRDLEPMEMIDEKDFR